MATFHPFPRLPAELRAHVWKSTVEPRTVEVRVEHARRVDRLVSHTPVPAALQANYEARRLGLYRPCLAELDAACVRRSRRKPAAGAEEEEGPRYVWLNLDVDTVSIGHTPLKCFDTIALSIARLRLNRYYANYFYESDELAAWKNTKEITVVCEDTVDIWLVAAKSHQWPCELENLRLYDPSHGCMVNCVGRSMCDCYVRRRVNGVMETIHTEAVAGDPGEWFSP